MNTSVQVRPVAPYTYDVFLGNGFDNWSRVKKHHWGMSLLQGERLERSILNTLHEIVKDHPNGSVHSFVIFGE